MTGKRGMVLRTVSTFALLAVVVAGCGSSPRPSSSERPLPRALAGVWATQASTIATAAASGNGCRARQLANSLRTEVMSAGGRVPRRLRTPLLESVKSLADRITCTPPVQVAPPKSPPKPGDKPPPKHKHEDHGHGGHGHEGEG
jgi:hypothetical protein